MTEYKGYIKKATIRSRSARIELEIPLATEDDLAKLREWVGRPTFMKTQVETTGTLSGAAVIRDYETEYFFEE